MYLFKCEILIFHVYGHLLLLLLFIEINVCNVFMYLRDTHLFIFCVMYDGVCTIRIHVNKQLCSVCFKIEKKVFYLFLKLTTTKTIYNKNVSNIYLGEKTHFEQKKNYS